MAKRLQTKRLIGLALFVCALFGGLVCKLMDLQVNRHDELRVKAAEYTVREILMTPRRGDILDARGNPLATSIFVKTVYADPSLIGNRHAEVARAVAPILGLREPELRDRLAPHFDDKGVALTNKYVVLKRKVRVETWQKVQSAMTNLAFVLTEGVASKVDKKNLRESLAKSITVEPVDDQLREYPNQSLAAHVLGFTATEEQKLNGKLVPETIGREGIEFQLNSKLAGASGWRSTEAGRSGRELVSARDQDVEARDGFNVVLTIDSFLQTALEAALADGMAKSAPQSISGLIIRPRTGEILAMATLPTFNPNNPGTNNPAARRNRVITDMMEPGSTFKIVPVSGALNDKTVRLTDIFDCENGRFTFAGHTLHDSHPHGLLNTGEIITKSSNIGAAKIGIKLGDDRLCDYIRSYGFGTKSGIPLPGESSGMVNRKGWTKVSVAQIPMGQGVAVTRLQMAMAMSAIANAGKLMQPMLVNRLQDREGRVMAQYSPQPVRQVISEAIAKQMVTALKTVVLPGGTAKGAAMEHYTVAGKTGTAQKAEHGVYVPGKFISSFIGFFPADNPEICISIVLDEPAHGHLGGDVAAPLFKQVADRAAAYLSIPPDKEDEKPTANGAMVSTTNSRVTKTVAARAPGKP